MSPFQNLLDSEYSGRTEVLLMSQTYQTYRAHRQAYQRYLISVKANIRREYEMYVCI